MPGIIHQNVESVDILQTGPGGGFVGNIEDPVRRVGEFGRQFLGPGPIDVHDDDFSAGLGEDATGLFPYTARPTRHQRRAPIDSERYTHRVNCNSGSIDSVAALDRDIVSCHRCPRLIGHCREVAATKRRAYLDWNYWGKPVPSFGDARGPATDYRVGPRRTRC